MEHAVAGTGVSADEWAVLSAVGLFRSVAPTQLATILRVPPTSISRYVARLAGAGLVATSVEPVGDALWVSAEADQAAAAAASSPGR
jgi:DNA-binding MarR family transcriptional regulator